MEYIKPILKSNFIFCSCNRRYDFKLIKFRILPGKTLIIFRDGKILPTLSSMCWTELAVTLSLCCGVRMHRRKALESTRYESAVYPCAVSRVTRNLSERCFCFVACAICCPPSLPRWRPEQTLCPHWRAPIPAVLHQVLRYPCHYILLFIKQPPWRNPFNVGYIFLVLKLPCLHPALKLIFFSRLQALLKGQRIPRRQRLQAY